MNLPSAPAVVRLVLVMLLGWGPAALPLAAAPRALPPGQRPEDQRRQPLKDLDGYFPFQPPASAEDWNRRAEWVRRQMRVSLGLWPEPTRTPLNPVAHGRIDAGEYTVEKVYFESVPGFFVTGNLYRPKGREGKLPGILCPHGHWNNGRFLDTDLAEVRREIASGAERFEEGGRSVLQARCVQLARMGCVVFHYDMLGYADSVQIPMAVAHGFAKQRPEMNTPEGWGLFSPQAEAQNQSVMGLQTWNSIRALDYLLSLEEVDPARIGVTGASGGGTQTFILGALDSRPAVIFPAVMVSTAMQGGCTCENACGLRIDTGNVEFAALFAPKPLGMTAANDWTKEMPTKGYPQLAALYRMLGVPDRVQLTPLLEFGHNYNYPSRAAMYGWFHQHLHLGAGATTEERDYRRLSREELSVWDAQHPAPAGGAEFERRLLAWLHADAQNQLRRAVGQPAEFRRWVGEGVAAVIGRALPAASELEWKRTTTLPGRYETEVGLLRNAARGEEVPLVILRPRAAKGRVVVWVSPEGKAGLWSGPGEKAELRASIQTLLRAGVTVVGVDLMDQGEFLGEEPAPATTRRVKNPREAAAYTFGYNRSLFAQRVHDLLTVVAWLQTRPRSGADPGAVEVALVGLAGAGPWVAAARAVAPEAIRRAAVDTGGFRFGQVREIHSPDFLPGGAKYLDLPGMLALAAPGAVLLAGEGSDLAKLDPVIRDAYRSNPGPLRLSAASAQELERVTARWLSAP